MTRVMPAVFNRPAPPATGLRFGTTPGIPTVSNPADFRREVLEADLPVLVKFSSPKCHWCQVVQPDVESLARKHAGHLRVVEVMLDKAKEPDFVREMAQTYDINRRGLPTFSLVVNGREQGELICTRDVIEALPATIESCLLPNRV